MDANSSNVLLRVEDVEIVTLRKDWIITTYGLSSCYCKAGRMVFKGGAHSLAADYAKSLLPMTTDNKFIQGFPVAVWALFQGAFKDRLEGRFASVIDITNLGKANPKFSVKCSSGLNCSMLTSLFDELKASTAILDTDEEKYPCSNEEFDDLVSCAKEQNRKILGWSSSLKHVIMSQMFYNDCSDLPAYSLVLNNCRVTYSREQERVIYELLQGASQEEREIFSNFNGAWNQMEPDGMRDASTSSDASIEARRGDGTVLERLLAKQFDKKTISADDERKRSAMIISDVIDLFFDSQFYTTTQSPVYTQPLDHYHKLFRAHSREYRDAYQVHDISEKEFNDAMKMTKYAYFKKDDFYVSAYARKPVATACTLPTVAYAQVAQTPVPQSTRPARKKISRAKNVIANGPVIVAAPLYEDLHGLLSHNYTMMIANSVHSQSLLNINLQRPSHITFPLRPVYIDGPNVACSFGNNGKSFDCRGLAVCVRLFFERGHRVIRVIVPQHRYEQREGQGHPPMHDTEGVLERLEELLILVRPGSSTAFNKTYQTYDDRTLLTLATANKAVVISNDNFRDLKGTKHQQAAIRRLGFICDGEDFVLIQDPGGRGGPDVDDWMKMNSHDLQELRAQKAHVQPHTLNSFMGHTKKKKGFQRSNTDQSGASSHMSTSPSHHIRSNPAVGFPSLHTDQSSPSSSHILPSPYTTRLNHVPSFVQPPDLSPYSCAATSAASNYSGYSQAPVFAPRTSNKPSHTASHAHSSASSDFSTHSLPHHSSRGALSRSNGRPKSMFHTAPKSMTVSRPSTSRSTATSPNPLSSAPRSMTVTDRPSPTFTPSRTQAAPRLSKKDDKIAKLLEFFPGNSLEVCTLVNSADEDEDIDTLATKMLSALRF